jgi:hypothetical protein
MTVKDLIKKKDYDYIEWRLTLPEEMGGDVFAGIAKSAGGLLVPLDGDTYDEDEKVLRYEEWTNEEKNIKSGLTVVIEGRWL